MTESKPRDWLKKISKWIEENPPDAFHIESVTLEAKPVVQREA